MRLPVHNQVAVRSLSYVWQKDIQRLPEAASIWLDSDLIHPHKIPERQIVCYFDENLKSEEQRTRF